MLEEARHENEQAIKQHENELSAMQRRIHSKTDEAFGKFHKTAIVSNWQITIVIEFWIGIEMCVREK